MDSPIGVFVWWKPALRVAYMQLWLSQATSAQCQLNLKMLINGQNALCPHWHFQLLFINNNIKTMGKQLNVLFFALPFSFGQQTSKVYITYAVLIAKLSLSLSFPLPCLQSVSLPHSLLSSVVLSLTVHFSDFLCSTNLTHSEPKRLDCAPRSKSQLVKYGFGYNSSPPPCVSALVVFMSPSDQ